MPRGYNGDVATGLLQELAEAEDRLAKVDDRLREVQAEFEVATRKYAAIRDMTTKYLGQSPYSWALQNEPTIDWTVIDWADTGRYRFIDMPIGNAVADALQEMNEPATLTEIVKKLRSGGIQRNINSLVRAVNAALMRTKGVVKDKDNKYRFEEEEEEELPF